MSGVSTWVTFPFNNYTVARLCTVTKVFQKTGSFKPRGSLNRLYHLTEAERKRESSLYRLETNAQGFAYAASLYGIPATVVMPHTTPPNKVNAARGHGAEVILTEGNLFDTGLKVQKEREPLSTPLTTPTSWQVTER